MPKSESWKPVAYEVDGIVVYIPSNWEPSDDDGETFKFEHSSGLCLTVEMRFFERVEDELPHPSEIDLLNDRDDPEIEWKSNPVMLASGAAIMSYRCGELDDPEWVKLYCELCRYRSPGVLDVIRFGGAIARDAMDHVEIVYWAHAVHDLARMTEFTAFYKDDGL
jgi:hypothetical protein